MENTTSTIAPDWIRVGSQGRQRLRDELPERVDVVGIVGHDVPMLVGVKVRNRKILHSVEHLAAQLVEKALGHVSHDLCIAHQRDQRQNVQHAQDRQVVHHLRTGCRPVAGFVPLFDHREHILHKQRGNRRDRRGKEHQHHCQRGQPRIVPEQLPDHSSERGEVLVQHGAGSLLIHPVRLPSSAAHGSRGRFRSPAAGSHASRLRRFCRCP